MVVKHHVNIGQAAGLNRVNAGPRCQMFGGNQYFPVFKIQRALVTDDQNSVVGRDQHIAFRHAFAKGPLLDQDRPEMAIAGQFRPGQAPLSNPTDLLHAVVTGDHTVANLQGFDPPLALRRCDHRAGGETRNNRLDLIKA